MLIAWAWSHFMVSNGRRCEEKEIAKKLTNTDLGQKNMSCQVLMLSLSGSRKANSSSLASPSVPIHRCLEQKPPQYSLDLANHQADPFQEGTCTGMPHQNQQRSYRTISFCHLLSEQRQRTNGVEAI